MKKVVHSVLTFGVHVLFETVKIDFDQLLAAIGVKQIGRLRVGYIYRIPFGIGGC